MNIAFRTDSSYQIGTGHLMRCLTLADELARRGHEILFVCRELEGNVYSLVRERGHDLALLSPPPSPGWVSAGEGAPAHAAWLGASQELDAKQTVTALGQGGAPLDWLIIDHYAIDANWESLLQTWCANLMVIDDLADRPHACGLLLDQNLHSEMECRYQELLPGTCHTLLGPKFALLRPEFVQARRELRTRTGVVQRVLVFFGGIDADNATLKSIEALSLTCHSQLTVDVVIGKGNPHQTELRRYCEGCPELRLHVQTERIAGLMAAADLAIGAGGIATWERCALGLPALVIALAYNQEVITDAVATTGAIRYLGAHNRGLKGRIPEEIQALLVSPEILKRMSERAAALVDAQGCTRVADKLEEMR